ncbi:NAD(P)-binding protein [Lentithecium fluviatile CBS 122367]|uniref:NAD(P)-binding protein n=1 Tax=Lentithecium fluviatile CBS 122367 TaxID=1168545 RepID=A0A6G1JPX3_9PLEO|nr:NAD(P)-binding protein [Lentithecium fluviatile CBS 122367]
MSIKTVALIGGTGTLGAPLLYALHASPFTIHILNRTSSKSTYPSPTSVLTIPDDLDVSTLTTIFKENAIDALVIALAGSHVATAKKLIEAAFNAGVKRVIPPDFGSCDSADEKTNEILPLMKGKKDVRDYLIELQEKDREGVGRMTWTSLITGHFFDFGLTCGLLNFDVKNRIAYILDGGDVNFSNSTLPFISEAVIRILQRSEETANKVLYVHSLRATQNELLAVLEKVTGAMFEKIEQSSEEELAKSRPKMLKGDKEAQEEVVAVWGIVATDWAGREGFANGLLGLEEEDLESVVRKALGE